MTRQRKVLEGTLTSWLCDVKSVRDNIDATEWEHADILSVEQKDMLNKLFDHLDDSVEIIKTLINREA